MSTALQKKLRLAPGTTIVTMNAPADYAATLGKLPAGVTITPKLSGKLVFIHWFVKDSAELERVLPKVYKALAPDGLLWLAYRKGGKTGLTRDKGWEPVMALGLRWLAQISFDVEWTAFLLQNAPEGPPTKASADYHANAAAWADPKTKTVKVPDDLAAAFKKNAKAKAAYEALAYTNRKEYVMWIVGAKREETRADRLAKTLEKLVAGKKNPSEK